VANFPASLDAMTNPTATTRRNDLGFELHAVISNLNDIVEALEAKLGIGSTSPDAVHKMLKATAGGTSAWGIYALTLISETIVAGADATVTFSSIPQTFRDLLLVVRGKTDRAAATDTLSIQLNGDAGAHYWSQQMSANGTTQTNAQLLAAASAVCGSIGGNTGVVGMSTVRIGDYARTQWHKPLTYESFVVGSEGSLGVAADFGGAVWNQTTAVTTVKAAPSNGINFKVGTVVTLYGVPGP
jgi:hypothetical protein